MLVTFCATQKVGEHRVSSHHTDAPRSVKKMNMTNTKVNQTYCWVQEGMFAMHCQQEDRKDVESLGSNFNSAGERKKGVHKRVSESAGLSCCIHNSFWLLAFRALNYFELFLTVTEFLWSYCSTCSNCFIPATWSRITKN